MPRIGGSVTAAEEEAEHGEDDADGEDGAVGGEGVGVEQRRKEWRSATSF